MRAKLTQDIQARLADLQFLLAEYKTHSVAPTAQLDHTVREVSRELEKVERLNGLVEVCCG